MSESIRISDKEIYVAFYTLKDTYGMNTGEFLAALLSLYMEKYPIQKDQENVMKTFLQRGFRTTLRKDARNLYDAVNLGKYIIRALSYSQVPINEISEFKNSTIKKAKLSKIWKDNDAWNKLEKLDEKELKRMRQYIYDLFQSRILTRQSLLHMDFDRIRIIHGQVKNK